MFHPIFTVFCAAPGFVFALPVLTAGYLYRVMEFRRLAGIPKGKTADEGIAIVCESIEQVREIRGIAGVHLMAIEWEHGIPEITERAGLLPGPIV